MEKGGLLDSYRSSFRSLQKNYLMTLQGVGIEVAFLLLFGFFAVPLRDAINQHLVYLSDELISASAVSGQITSVILESVSYHKILQLGFAFAVLFYVLYCLFQGFLWKFCLSFSSKKKQYASYLKKFFLVNLFWYPFFIAYVLLSFLLSYMDTVAERYNPEGFFSLSWVSTLFLLAIVYFAFLSYVFIDKEKVWKSILRSFKVGFSRIKTVLGMYAGIIVVFGIVHMILIFSGQLSEVLSFIVGLFLVLPLFLWIRIVIGKMVQAL